MTALISKLKVMRLKNFLIEVYLSKGILQLGKIHIYNQLRQFIYIIVTEICLNIMAENILVMPKSVITSKSHHNVKHLHLVTNVPTKYSVSEI